MTRRKKLLKLGLLSAKAKSRRDRRYESMLAEISKNIKKRKQNKQFQKIKREEWIKEYSEILNQPKLQIREGWAKGLTPKKSIFEPLRLEKLDTDEINIKRKMNGITKTIEESEKEAMEEIKRKAKMVAPAYSKGAYQFLGNNKQNIKDAGKKNSEMDSI